MNGFEVSASRVLIPDNITENAEFLSIFTDEEKKKYGLNYDKPETETKIEDKEETVDDSIEHSFDIFENKTRNEKDKSD